MRINYNKNYTFKFNYFIIHNNIPIKLNSIIKGVVYYEELYPIRVIKKSSIANFCIDDFEEDDILKEGPYAQIITVDDKYIFLDMDYPRVGETFEYNNNIYVLQSNPVPYGIHYRYEVTSLHNLMQKEIEQPLFKHAYDDPYVED